VVILGLDKRVSVAASAIFAAAYTIVGGFYSVSYTDVLQQGLITIGLVSVDRHIHSQLYWAILLCDVIPDGKKLSKLRSFERQ
jgi:Na+(H+)/acetate symporter ActP